MLTAAAVLIGGDVAKACTSFIVTLRTEPSSVPAETRLRAGLKALLRQRGLRCTDVRELNYSSDEPVTLVSGDAARREESANLD